MNSCTTCILFISFFLSSPSSCILKKKTNLPWEKSEKKNLPPSEPYKDYTPIVVPNGSKAPYEVIDGIKIFHLTAEEISWEVADGLTINTWGYNGMTPGPLLEIAEGDKVRIYVTNHLTAPTTIHWHGVLLPCGMDGVATLTQPSIEPNQTFIYEFIFPDAGTFMYHPHYDSMTQEGMGLTGMIIVHKREPNLDKRPDRDFAIMLHEWSINVGTSKPNPLEMSFNILTMNGKVMPATEPLVAEIGDRVWIRYGNLSAMDHHPIHLHGYSFKIIGSDGGWIDNKEAVLPETTVLVPTGTARVIEFIANNPGDWIFHCHMTHHIMNQMGHNFPNMLGMKSAEFTKKMQKLFPGFMAMGTKGMRDMTKTGKPIPPNSIPMLGYKGPFGQSVIGGMANIFRVREKTENYQDPGPYIFPQHTMAQPATQADLIRDKIKIHPR